MALVGAAWELLSIRDDLSDAEAILDELELDDVRDAGGVSPLIREAADRIDAADRTARTSPFLSVLSPIPIVGEQVEGLRELTSTTRQLGELAVASGDRIDTAIDDAGGDGRSRLALIDTLRDELAHLGDAIAELDTGDAALLGPAASARRQLDESLASAPRRLAELDADLAEIRDLLAGPTSYLLVVGNSAEMRAGAGMPLQAGLITFTDGEFEVGELLSTVRQMYIADPTGPFNSTPPPDRVATYPRWNLGRDFPETAVIPDFTVTAPIYADIAADTQGWEVEGVVQLDVVALAELLEATGPITVDGVTYDADNAAEEVLLESYLEFEDFAERDERQDRQSDLARALFASLGEDDTDPLDLVEAFRDAAEGRHLLAWSRSETLQELYTSFGASGSVPAGSMLVSVQNTAANKLDFFIEPSVTLRADELDDRHRISVEVEIPNPVPDRSTRYIDGNLIEPRGTHRTFVSFHVPRAARNLVIDGFTPTEQGFDGAVQVIGVRFEIPRGSSQTVELTFDLPPPVSGVTVLPSGRLQPVEWTLRGVRGGDRTVTDATAFAVGFEPIASETRELRVPLLGLLLAVAGVSFTVKAQTAGAPTSGREVRLGQIDVATAAVLLTGAAVAVGVHLLG